MMAFTVSGVFAVIIYYGQIWGMIGIGAVATLLLVRTRDLHRVREKEETALDVFNLRKISESVRDIALRAYVHVSNNHSGLLDSQIEELDRILRKRSIFSTGPRKPCLARTRRTMKLSPS